MSSRRRPSIAKVARRCCLGNGSGNGPPRAVQSVEPSTRGLPLKVRPIWAACHRMGALRVARRARKRKAHARGALRAARALASSARAAHAWGSCRREAQACERCGGLTNSPRMKPGPAEQGCEVVTRSGSSAPFRRSAGGVQRCAQEVRRAEFACVVSCRGGLRRRREPQACNVARIYAVLNVRIVCNASKLLCFSVESRACYPVEPFGVP